MTTQSHDNNSPTRFACSCSSSEFIRTATVANQVDRGTLEESFACHACGKTFS
jgi:transcription elongation factor Elf1